MSEDTKLVKVASWISKYMKSTLMFHTMEKKTPVSRLIAIALEHELERENPFTYEVTLPEEKYEEFAYAAEAGKIIEYLRDDMQGMGLDMMCLCRNDVGIPDKETFLLAFRECLEKGFLESYTPIKKQHAYTEYPEGYLFYRLKGENAPAKRKKRKEASEYSRFKRLERKYKDK